MIENTPIQQQKAARAFAERWAGKGYEKGESQKFWTTLLTEVFGIEHVDSFLTFEQQVKLDHTSFIDVFIPSTHVMIEQKSLGKNLADGIKQSDGSVLNPFQQAKRYAAELPYSQRPRWIVTCNFAEFWVYDMEQPNGEPQKILLENLEKDYERLLFLVDAGNEHIKREMDVSVKAGALVGKIYDLLLKQYYEPENPETLRSLNILCVRLVFCLYAEDAHLFGKRTAFHDYLAQYDAKDLRRALIDLFQVLDTPIEQRDRYLDETLKAFPYVNGGLFSSSLLGRSGGAIIPQFTEELKELLLAKASDDFDWSEISPTIFGAVFESTLNPETRRSGGMHYTSIENIHKVIDPLFLDSLKAEFETIKAIPQEKQQRQRLDAFQDKLASLTFFDPACGSGNFLTESFISLRRLENQVIALRNKGQAVIGDFADPIKVNIHQFYGIEINDFAVSVATTALWIAEEQMLQETAKIVSFAIDPLPLKSYHNIHEGNALRMDWNEVFPISSLSGRSGGAYIMGNPPFVGASYCTDEQKKEIVDLYGNIKLSNSLDYVSGWYLKAAQMMDKNSAIKAAFVSTNSITQGEQVAPIWATLFDRYKVQIDFAYRTFRWDSEADIKAHVHCVIIGFSVSSVVPEYNSGTSPSISPELNSGKTIYLSDSQSIKATNINGYLLDAPSVYIESRGRAICPVQAITHGSKPSDGGFLILSPEEKNDLIKREPLASKYIRRYSGGIDFLRNQERYCLWLVDISPKELNSLPAIKERVANVQKCRLESTSKSTREKASTPWLFFTNLQPTDGFMLVGPQVSSGRRRYIPWGFYSSDVIASDKLLIMPHADLYTFGIMSSNVHNAWVRVVAGRLKSDYTYSVNIVYNNFPWPGASSRQTGGVASAEKGNLSPEMVARIEQTAQAILDARAKYPDCSLADLYDEVAMPPELRRAHQENDRAVMAAYGFPPATPESDCVAELFKMYQDLTK